MMVMHYKNYVQYILHKTEISFNSSFFLIIHLQITDSLMGHWKWVLDILSCKVSSCPLSPSCDRTFWPGTDFCPLYSNLLYTIWLNHEDPKQPEVHSTLIRKQTVRATYLNASIHFCFSVDDLQEKTYHLFFSKLWIFHPLWTLMLRLESEKRRTHVRKYSPKLSKCLWSEKNTSGVEIC